MIWAVIGVWLVIGTLQSAALALWARRYMLLYENRKMSAKDADEFRKAIPDLMQILNWLEAPIGPLLVALFVVTWPVVTWFIIQSFTEEGE